MTLLALTCLAVAVLQLTVIIDLLHDGPTRRRHFRIARKVRRICRQVTPTFDDMKTLPLIDADRIGELRDWQTMHAVRSLRSVTR